MVRVPSDRSGVVMVVVVANCVASGTASPPGVHAVAASTSTSRLQRRTGKRLYRTIVLHSRRREDTPLVMAVLSPPRDADQTSDSSSFRIGLEAYDLVIDVSTAILPIAATANSGGVCLAVLTHPDFTWPLALC